MSLSFCLRLALTFRSLHRGISTSAAKSMLGFAEDQNFSIRELRHAYFEAAKRYHPDVVRQQQSEGHDSPLDFRDITEAYEHLLSGDHSTQYSEEEMANIVTISEDEEYRQACHAMLGLPAEIVEESKQNPMFRRWLTGNTDAAHHWRAFFAAHGGLAQKLRPPAGYLGQGGEKALKKSETRRKKSRK
jgi:DnaJ-class molecular chaperone